MRIGRLPSYTSGHDCLDAERASCLTNTPFGTLCQAMAIIGRFPCVSSTAWVERVLQFSILWQLQFHVSRSGVRIPVMAIFSLFFLLPTFCHGQSTENICLNNFIDWLIWVAIGVTAQKMALTGIRTPDLETWNWNCHSMLNCITRSTHAVEENKESALWLPIASHSVPMGAH